MAPLASSNMQGLLTTIEGFAMIQTPLWRYVYRAFFIAVVQAAISLCCASAMAAEAESRMRGIHRQLYASSCGFASLSTLLYALGDVAVSEAALIDTWTGLLSSR